MPGRDNRYVPDVTVTPDVSGVVLSARTLAMEARAAVTVVAALRDRGVSIRDIVVVAPDIARYERQLRRAAVRHELVPTLWTQLELAATEPYRLCAAICAVLDADGETPVSIETVCAPLEHGWVPPSSASTATTEAAEWGVDAATLHRVRAAAPATEQSRAAWAAWLRDTAAASQLAPYAAWLTAPPAVPTPAAITDVLGGLVERYDAVRLPQRRAADTPALLETERAVRAVVRLEELLERVAGKYGEWTATGRAPASWATVGRLCESLATQRPGRREHGNARALDIVEASDMWARSDPYVVAVGLTDGVWPSRPASPLPPAARHAVLAGTDGLAALAPRLRWRGYHAADAFADTVAAATQGLVLTHHTETQAGAPAAPSPFLAATTFDSVAPAAVRELLAEPRSIPPALAAVLPADSASSSNSPE
jgi:ATP-dependent helicase/nuclease subunit B